jgi:aminomethyltransferase
MPITYEGINAEHETVQTAVGVLMCRTWENFLLTGPNAFILIQKSNPE